MKQILSNDIINQYMPTLVKCPLFNTLGEPELRVIIHSYKKNDFIALAGDPMEGIGVILEGSALLTRENVMGQRVIMANLEQSDIFGEALLFSKQPLWPATIKATKATKIMFIPLETFIKTLPDCHQCQTKILSNLLEDLSEKAILLKRQHSNTIQLPHNREQMAEVLNVSRTALSRELGRLRDEGLIDITGRTVTIKNIEDIEEFGFNTF
ncbi:MAG: Crp/Fnr family transcriptional regulator [Veillonella sp.]|nr:Crp/Fnr family transcriptional regulator [Veillonella sp.]